MIYDPVYLGLGLYDTLVIQAITMIPEGKNQSRYTHEKKHGFGRNCLHMFVPPRLNCYWLEFWIMNFKAVIWKEEYLQKESNLGLSQPLLAGCQM